MRITTIIIVTLTLLGCFSSINATEPLRGIITNYKEEPIKGVKIRKSTSENPVKTDRLGEFIIDNVEPSDTIIVEYKGKQHPIAVNGTDNIKLIVDKDDKNINMFTRNGEMFHGTLMNYKGKPIRGATVYLNDPFEYVKSDKQGEFNIDNVVYTDTIHIKYDGYIHDIAVDGSKGMYIIIGRNNGRRVSDDMVNMGAGQVDARYYNGPRNVRTAAQLEATGHSDLVKAMIGIPGVSLR
ncbi:MAG: carboxypeptidase-like regulatory domain-containing protein, partial [Muribaculaceae bacterium]|nr:carboxypeptidase-like regulatory domain-containing protein [Muribaculaceae bacterium]